MAGNNWQDPPGVPFADGSGQKLGAWSLLKLLGHKKLDFKEL